MGPGAKPGLDREGCQGGIVLSFLWMCIVGLAAGALAKLAMPGKDPGGILVTMLLGIAGSLVAGFAGRILGFYKPGEGAGLLMSVAGASLLLAVYRRYRRGAARAGSAPPPA
jgi:uncharacterized membrane protein YeaQ/YmgE (transglycosylase-associated protein family)